MATWLTNLVGKAVGTTTPQQPSQVVPSMIDKLASSSLQPDDKKKILVDFKKVSEDTETVKVCTIGHKWSGILIR